MTLDDLKVFLNIAEDDESYDQVIESLYTLSKQIFYQFTRRRIDLEEFTDTYPRFTGDVLYLYNSPSTEIIEVVASDGSELPYFERFEDALYFARDILNKSVSVTYKAGYETIPSSIDHILTQLVSFFWNYDATKVFLSGTAEGILRPNEMEIPKHIQDNMAIYRVGI
jgi:hypothetical protein